LLLGVAAKAQYRDSQAPYQAPPPNQGTYQAANVIPEGTRFVVRLDDNLDTSKIKPGKKFNAKLGEDLVAPNGVAIPAGKKVHGHISEVERGMHGRVLLSFDEIETRHGWRPLAATITDVPGEHGVKQVSNEGEIEKQGPTKRRVAEGAVVGAAVGAAAGGAAAGAHGAAIGAVAGGALGGGSGLLLDRDFKLNKGQQLELRLDRPLQVAQ
jgi:hypothetical protein